MTKGRLEYLTHTIPTNSTDAWQISVSLDGNATTINFPPTANRGFEGQATTNPFNAAPVLR